MTDDRLHSGARGEPADQEPVRVVPSVDASGATTASEEPISEIADTPVPSPGATTKRSVLGGATFIAIGTVIGALATAVLAWDGIADRNASTSAPRDSGAAEFQPPEAVSLLMAAIPSDIRPFCETTEEPSEEGSMASFGT